MIGLVALRTPSRTGQQQNQESQERRGVNTGNTLQMEIGCARSRFPRNDTRLPLAAGSTLVSRPCWDPFFQDWGLWVIVLWEPQAGSVARCCGNFQVACTPVYCKREETSMVGWRWKGWWPNRVKPSGVFEREAVWSPFPQGPWSRGTLPRQPRRVAAHRLRPAGWRLRSSRASWPSVGSGTVAARPRSVAAALTWLHMKTQSKTKHCHFKKTFQVTMKQCLPVIYFPGQDCKLTLWLSQLVSSCNVLLLYTLKNQGFK